MSVKKRVAHIQTLPVLALRGLVVFPGVPMHFDVGRKKSILALNEAMTDDQLLFLVAQKDVRSDDPGMDELYEIGVVAKVRQVLRLPGDSLRIMVEGLYRARLECVQESEPFLVAVTKEVIERRILSAEKEEAVIRECQTRFEEYAELYKQVSSDAVSSFSSAESAGNLLDLIAFHAAVAMEDKQKLLSTSAVEKRAELLLSVLKREMNILELEKDIQDKVHEQIDQNQREYYLREQMKVISAEIGEEDNPIEEADEYRCKIALLQLEKDSEEKLLKECSKLSKMPSGSHEATVVRNYLDTCLSLPWNQVSKDKIDLAAARKILDRDHFGLEKVKDRIVELLAVRSLNPAIKGQVVCLAGPPGVGKTSIVRSIAEAMGRKYVRVSLGGVRDEADIRGHRKTYIGAMPGRIINAIKQAGVSNPVILLDEIDKMSNDFRGDPSSAMLEVLDGEQNFSFYDHYLEIPFDLSKVLFITTANNVDEIPAPLLDRMDVIPLYSYTAEEKFHIAKNHLLKKQLKLHGLNARQVRIADEKIYQMIEGYVREAGVRNLERTIAKVLRVCAKRIVSGEVKSITVHNLEEFLGPRKYKPDVRNTHDEVGVVTGLAWTSVGGETMPVEVAVLDGNGKIELTGSLGDVMKESARTAVSYVRSRADDWHIDKEFYKNKDIHIHVPEGAVPKDGPSAGVTMATALVSALTGVPVHYDVAMTGEISLRGRVLPIGGLKEKTMAAYKHGIKTVIIPIENESDLEEVDSTVKEQVAFVTAAHLDTVIHTALTKDPASIVCAKPAETLKKEEKMAGLPQ